MLSELRKDVSKRISASSIEDKLKIVKLMKVKVPSVNGKFSVECKGLTAPDSGEYWLYVFGNLDPAMIGLEELNPNSLWVTGDNLVNANSAKDVFVYTNKGYILPNHLCYFTRSKNGTVYLAIKKHDIIKNMDIDTLFYRHYRNRWLQSSGVKGVRNVSNDLQSTYSLIGTQHFDMVGSYDVRKVNNLTTYLRSPMDLQGDFELIVGSEGSSVVDIWVLKTDQTVIGTITQTVDTVTFVNQGGVSSSHSYTDIATIKRVGRLLTISTDGVDRQSEIVNLDDVSLSRGITTLNSRGRTIKNGTKILIPWESSTSYTVIPGYLTDTEVRYIAKTHVNGMYLRAPAGTVVPAGSLTDAHIDNSVDSVINIAIKNRANFLSTMDSNNKYIIPVRSAIDGDYDIKHFSDMDIYVTVERGLSYTGLYLGTHDKKSVSMITNNVIGLSVDHFNTVGNELINVMGNKGVTVTLDDLYVTVVYKKQNRVMKLLPNSSAMYSLASLPLSKILSVLAGKDGLEQWKPEVLEDSDYFKLMNYVDLEEVSNAVILSVLGYDGLLAIYNTIYPTSNDVNSPIQSPRLYREMHRRIVDVKGGNLSPPLNPGGAESSTGGSLTRVMPGSDGIIYSDTRAVPSSTLPDLTWTIPPSASDKYSVEVVFNDHVLVEDIDYFIEAGLITITSTIYVSSGTPNTLVLVLDVVTDTGEHVKHYEYGMVTTQGLVSSSGITNMAPGHYRVLGGEISLDVNDPVKDKSSNAIANIVNKPYSVKRPILDLDELLGDGETKIAYHKDVNKYYAVEQYRRAQGEANPTVYDGQITRYSLYSPFLQDVVVRADAVERTAAGTLAGIDTASEIRSFCDVSEELMARDPLYQLDPMFDRYVDINPVSKQGHYVMLATVEFMHRVLSEYGLNDKVYWVDADFNIIQ